MSFRPENINHDKYQFCKCFCQAALHIDTLVAHLLAWFIYLAHGSRVYLQLQPPARQAVDKINRSKQLQSSQSDYNGWIDASITKNPEGTLVPKKTPNNIVRHQHRSLSFKQAPRWPKGPLRSVVLFIIGWVCRQDTSRRWKGYLRI